VVSSLRDLNLKNLAGRRVLVLGLGLHGGGLAVVQWLARHQAKVTVTDLRSGSELRPTLSQLKKLPIKYVLGSHPLSLLRGCDLIVQNPAVPAQLPLLVRARRLGIKIENEASLFLKLCPSKLVIGVTGSKGKSTTAALLGSMLRRWNKKTVIAGNIRDTVMFNVLDKVTETTPVVLELSSWHLELVGHHRLNLPLAVITNVHPEHLNRYSSLASYAQAKAQIFKYQSPDQVVVLNYDNKTTRGFSRQAKSGVYWFSTEKPVPVGVWLAKGAAYWRVGGKNFKLFDQSEVKMSGVHNMANVLAATTAARLVGVPVAKIIMVLRSFVGFHDRLELVKKVKNVDFYNDTAATAPVATSAALQTFKGRRVVLIAGGTDKNLSYAELARQIKRQVASLILLPGTATVKIQRQLKTWPHVLLASSMSQAVRLAASCAPAGSVVLLSPGAASFGLFKHEFDRGRQFKLAVKALAKK